MATVRNQGFAVWHDELHGTRHGPRSSARAQAGAAVTSDAFLIRRVASIEDLNTVFSVVGEQLKPPIAPPDRRLDHLIEGFEGNRHLMLVAEREGHIVGGVLGVQLGVQHEQSVGVSIVGFHPSVQGAGLARRMLQIIEVEAMARGARRIGLGARAAAKGFYESLGYQGRGHYMEKGLLLPGPSVERRVAKWMAKLGDLDNGEPIRIDSTTGKVPEVF